MTYSSILSRTVLLVASLLAAADTIHAQSTHDTPVASSSLRFAVGGGFAESAPFGGRGVGDIGYNFSGALERRTLVPGLRVRGDGFFANWGSGQHLAALTAGVALRTPDRWRVGPALTAAVGAYRPSRNARLDPGWSLGGGLRVPLGRQALLLESRIHAFNVGARGLATAGVAPFDVAYNRWQYTYTPLTFSIQF